MTQNGRWLHQFIFDPIESLMSSGDPVIQYYVERDLLDRPSTSIDSIWENPEVAKILKKQRSGFWKSGKSESEQKQELTETWRQLRFLIQKYEMNKRHSAISSAAEYVFSCQSEEGDFRGILSNQYAPYYTGALLGLLIDAGYQDDQRIEKGIQWLLSVRQTDGGWVIGSPGMMNYSWQDVCALTSKWTALPERHFDFARPFSAAGTGMALRALAAHPAYRSSEAALKAAALLKSKFLKRDNWSWYQHPDNWIRFQFPYWWNHLLAALDTLSLIGVPKDDPDVALALEWFVRHQHKDGLWKESYSRIHKNSENSRSKETRLWISLTVCRVFKRYFRD